MVGVGVGVPVAFTDDGTGNGPISGGLADAGIDRFGSRIRMKLMVVVVGIMMGPFVDEMRIVEGWKGGWRQLWIVLGIADYIYEDKDWVSS